MKKDENSTENVKDSVEISETIETTSTMKSEITSTSFYNLLCDSATNCGILSFLKFYTKNFDYHSMIEYKNKIYNEYFTFDGIYSKILKKLRK